MIEYYQYKPKRKIRPVISTVRPTLATQKEQLLGMVAGKNATDNEERFARGIGKYKDVEYYFRFPIGEFGKPGWKELDFLVFRAGMWYAFQIDDVEFVHKGQGAMAEDRLTDVIILSKLRQYGVREIKHIPSTQLANQEIADRTIRGLLV